MEKFCVSWNIITVPLTRFLHNAVHPRTKIRVSWGLSVHIYFFHSLEFEREMMHFEPIAYISSTKAQSILMQLVVLFLWDWMRSSRLFYGLSLTSSWTILNSFCLLQCWNTNFLYLGCSHSIFSFNFWCHFLYNIKICIWNHLNSYHNNVWSVIIFEDTSYVLCTL